MWVLAAIVIVLHFSWRIYTRRSISSQQKKILTLLQKMSVLLKVLKKELQHSIENIDAGNSEITEEELIELVKLLATINKGGERISKTIACEKILHCVHLLLIITFVKVLFLLAVKLLVLKNFHGLKVILLVLN